MTDKEQEQKTDGEILIIYGKMKYLSNIEATKIYNKLNIKEKARLFDLINKRAEGDLIK